MTDEVTNNATPDGTAEQAAEESSEDKSGGLKKFMLPGAIGGGVIAITVVLVMVFFGGDMQVDEQATETAHDTEVTEKPSASQESEKAHPSEDKHQASAESHESDQPDEELTAEEMANLDFLIDESDQTVIDQITASLEFLDYDPSADLEEMRSEEVSGMSREDSIETANWIETEKAALTEREKAVAAREKEQDELYQEIQRKILIIEQAESNRISKLAKLYDGMDARSVTKLMANLDDATVVSVISRMKQKNASAVLELISPKRAARLSKMMITIAEN